jgi:hypothetical protein
MSDIEYASMGGATGDGWRALANDTGLSFETVAALGSRNRLDALFGADGKLLDGTELRSREAAGSLLDRPAAPRAAALIDSLATQYPEVGAVADAARRRKELAYMKRHDGREAMLEVMRLRWPETG